MVAEEFERSPFFSFEATLNLEPWQRFWNFVPGVPVLLGDVAVYPLPHQVWQVQGVEVVVPDVKLMSDTSKGGMYIIWCPHWEGVPQKQTRVVISCVSVTVTKGEGGPKIRKSCGRLMYMPPNRKIFPSLLMVKEPMRGVGRSPRCTGCCQQFWSMS